MIRTSHRIHVARSLYRVSSLFVFVGIVCAGPHLAQAATVSLTPSITSVSAGNIITVHVVVNTQGTAINDGSATVQFPTDLLEVVSVSKSASIFSLWVEEPTFSNSAGTVSFDGGVPTPGYQGSGGTMLDITFRAKKTGTASVLISDANVLANDGQGTDVYTGATNDTITITPPAPASPVSPAPVSKPTVTPPIIQTTPTDTTVHITSSTHPSQDAWYAENVAQLAFDLPPKSTAIKFLVSQDQTAVPTKIYKPAITQKSTDALTDGTWYVQINALAGGVWGPVSTYTLNIDTTPPNLTITSLVYDADTKTVTVTGSAQDDTSGFGSLSLVVDGVAAQSDVGGLLTQGSVEVPLDAAPGQHVVKIRAVDRAGNYTDSQDYYVTVPVETYVPKGVVAITTWYVETHGTLLLIVLALGISLLSLLFNIILWNKLRFYRKRPHSGVAHIKEQTKERLMDLKKDLRKQSKLYEKTTAHKTTTKEEAVYAKKMQAHIADVEQYVDRKIQDINKRS